MSNISTIQNQCFGCRSCEQVCPQNCITMISSNEGFLYPFIDEEKCVDCNLCLKACPVENSKEHRDTPKSVWGLKNKNNIDIMKSASGGAADIISKIILQQGGIVYGAAYDENLVVKHIEVTCEKEKYKLQSSKYVQSDTNDCYSRVRRQLGAGKKVLFTGTPCQIAGLYSFLGKDMTNLYTLDLICHGVPSPKFFEKYLEYQKHKLKENILYFNFRSKEKRGWGTQYLLKTKTKTKKRYISLTLDRYGNHFMKGDCYRECCYSCPFSNLNRVADITVGDFWGVSQSHPEFYSSKGVSSVFINSNKGRALFEKIRSFSDYIPITVDEGLFRQGNLVKPSIRPLSRDTFYDEIESAFFIEKMKNGIQIKERIKSILPIKVINCIKRHI